VSDISLSSPGGRETLILASKSAARRAMLENAGVPFEVRVAGVDEDAIITNLLSEHRNQKIGTSW